MPINYEPSCKWNQPLKTKNEELTRELDQVIGHALSQKHTSTSYAVMIDDQLVASNALGTTGGKDPKPATVDCTYNVASVSKIYTTAAVMQLVEKGVLDLDKPIITWLPGFKTLNPESDQITLRHCLSHSCGLPGTQWIDFSVSDQSKVDYYKDALDFYAHSHVKHVPGEYSVYCNDGFTMAEMVVAAVCEEKDFSEYCRKHITDPLGAWSSRFARSYNPDYTMIAEGKKPAELVTCQGMGGLTTTMEHLAIFGNQFLLQEGSPILTRKSMDEMCSLQGRTFLKKDVSTGCYGLGWDNVCYQHPDYDLGDNAFRKGGASFQFASQLLIVPKYNAVVALSQTYDCELDGRSTALQLLSLSLLRQKGINITRFKNISESFIQKYTGDYLSCDTSFRVTAHGPYLFINTETAKGKKSLWKGPFCYTGRHFVNEEGRIVDFETATGTAEKALNSSSLSGRYLLTSFHDCMTPIAEKVKDGPALSPTWQKRLNKKYINVTITPYDEIVNGMMAGFQLLKYKDHKGILIAAFHSDEDSPMDCPVKPLSANVATGFARIPDDGGRDLVSTLFYREKGVEYCTTASYTFRDAETLPEVTADQLTDFSVLTSLGAPAFRLDGKNGKLEKLPKVPEGHRLMLLNDKLNCVYDSLMDPDSFKPMEKGYGIWC